MIRWVCAGALLLAVTALIGCEKKRTDVVRARVTGKVTLDGKVLDTGTVTFESTTGEAPGVCNILDGKYEGMAAVGKNKVRLSAFRKISMKEKMKMDGPGYDQMVEENLLPAKYNDGNLVREVIADGPNNFDFDLKSK